MPSDLEAPPGTTPDWATLYLARGDEVNEVRPVMTGDVFEDVPVCARNVDGEPQRKTVVVVQHPCAIRAGGIRVVEAGLVAEVRTSRVLSAEEWRGFLKQMPLPALRPELTSNRRDQAAY